MIDIRIVMAGLALAGMAFLAGLAILLLRPDLHQEVGAGIMLGAGSGAVLVFALAAMGGTTRGD